MKVVERAQDLCTQMPRVQTIRDRLILASIILRAQGMASPAEENRQLEKRHLTLEVSFRLCVAGREPRPSCFFERIESEGGVKAARGVVLERVCPKTGVALSPSNPRLETARK